MQSPLVTEAEFLSAALTPEGELTWTRDNGEVVVAGEFSGTFAAKTVQDAVETGRLSESGLVASIGATVRSEAVPLDRVNILARTPDVRSVVAASGSVQRLEIPGHLNGPTRFQATHPSVKFFPEGWNGWRYWMAFTPYPGGNAAHEDPCISVSQDGKTWTTPAGFTNPLDDGPDASHYNADTELAISPDGTTLYCMWRYTDTTTRVVQFKVRSTTDGVNWTPAVVALTHADYLIENYVSQTLVHDGTQWVMWGINIASNPNKLVRLTATDVTGPWSTATDCVATAGTGRDFWHVSVIRTADGYVALMNDTTVNLSGVDGDLYLMTSPDGVTWTNGLALFERPFGTEFTGLYRGTLVPTESGFDVWFGGYNATSQWGIFRAQLSIDAAARQVSTKWVPAWEFRPPVAGPTEGVLFSIVNGWLLDSAAVESVATTVDLAGWKKFDAEVWFATINSNTGDFVVNMNYRHIAAGGTLGSPTAVTAPPMSAAGVAGSVITSSIIKNMAVTAEGPWYFRVMRDGAHAADTLTADVMFLGLRLIRRA